MLTEGLSAKGREELDEMLAGRETQRHTRPGDLAGLGGDVVASPRKAEAGATQ